MNTPGEPYPVGVLYRRDDRHGPTRAEYDEAIADLTAARDEEPASGCGVCGDSGHTAAFCHHNPLVMARRAVCAARVWRCYHCNAVFADHAAAAEHFGRGEEEAAKCLRAARLEDAIRSAAAELESFHVHRNRFTKAYIAAEAKNLADALRGFLPAQPAPEGEEAGGG